MARLGAFLNPGAHLDEALSLASRADALGYESLWVTHGFGRDAFIVLAAYAQAAPRVGLGSGVIPIYPRHPVAMAQEAITLSEVSGGRLRLGIGVSHRSTIEHGFGIDMGRPLEVMREYVAVLNDALRGRVVHAGPRYRADWQLRLADMPAPPPVLLAGLGTAMLELAGEIADGAVLWLCAPSYIREHALPAVRRGRERAGKLLDGFEIVAAVPLAMTVDRPGGAALFKAELTRYLTLPFYRAMLAKSGFEADLASFDRNPTPGGVSDRLAAALGAVGDYRTLSDFVAEHRAAGVTLPVIRPVGFPDAPHYLPTLEAAVSC